MSSSTPVTMTRTGRRVVPTPAAAAAAADKAAAAAAGAQSSVSSTPGGSTSSGSTATAVVGSVSTPSPAGAKAGGKNVRGTKGDEKDTSTRPVQKSTPVSKDTATEGGDTPKRRGGLRTTRLSSGSVDDGATEVSGGTNPPPAKKLKTAESPSPAKPTAEETAAAVVAPTESEEIAQSAEVDTSANTGEGESIEIDAPGLSVPESEFVEGVPLETSTILTEETKEMHTSAETEAVAAISDDVDTQQLMETDTQEMESQMLEQTGHIVEDTDQNISSVISLGEPAADEQIQQTRQKSAVESILPDVRELDDEDGLQGESETESDAFPPWNEQGCIICNVDIAIDDPTTAPKNHEKIKEFFLEFFSIGDQISLEEENAFPFCNKCAEDMESLLGINHRIEFMHKQFNKMRDSLAKKAIKTFLVRTKPSCLEEDAKTESYGFLDEDQKKPYKDQMFHLWRSRYELVQPGPKTPVMIRSMDSRGRVTVVRLNSQGQPIPEKFGSLNKRFSGADIPIGIGRTVINGDDDRDGDDNGVLSLDIYQCRDCSKAFSTKSMLAYHSRIHTGELPFECDLCGKAFAVPHYLMTHMRSHTGEKPYKCTECGKGFAQRGGLVTHALVHSGAKPYSCQICGKSFRQKYHLTQHNLIHSGVKPFTCDLCGKCFNVKMNLREHMRRHTGDRPYKCPYCTTIGFFRKKMLKDHIVKAHPQRKMPVELMGPDVVSSSGDTPATATSADSNDSSQSADDLHSEDMSAEETGHSIEDIDEEGIESILPHSSSQDEEKDD